MRISDWSSDVCSSDLSPQHHGHGRRSPACRHDRSTARRLCDLPAQVHDISTRQENEAGRIRQSPSTSLRAAGNCLRSEEHTSELQSLMRISYAVFCLLNKFLLLFFFLFFFFFFFFSFLFSFFFFFFFFFFF